MRQPLVTVLMPVYNGERFIAEAIGSVLSQRFTDFELVIVNDGSTDGTGAVIDSFRDERIIRIDQPNAGVASALNKGLSIARAALVARMDADDVCYPDRLQRQYDFLDARPDYVIVGSDADFISETGEFLCGYTSPGYSHEEIMTVIGRECPFQHSSVLFRKDAVMRCGGYPGHAHNFEDYLLWVQLKRYGKFHSIPEALIRYRFNPASVTIDEKWRGRRFRTLKRSIIAKGHITEEEGVELLSIIASQDTRRIKEGAYHALCGKKFLVNNYQPSKARKHIMQSILAHPARLDNYALWMASYLPERMIRWMHRKIAVNL